MGAFRVPVTLIALLAASCNHENAANQAEDAAVKTEMGLSKSVEKTEVKSANSGLRTDNTLGPVTGANLIKTLCNSVYIYFSKLEG